MNSLASSRSRCANLISDLSCFVDSPHTDQHCFFLAALDGDGGDGLTAAGRRGALGRVLGREGQRGEAEAAAGGAEGDGKPAAQEGVRLQEGGRGRRRRSGGRARR